jgi:hypothetical protein
VNLIRVRDGRIVEARGYVKTEGAAGVTLDRTMLCLRRGDRSGSDTPERL